MNNRSCRTALLLLTGLALGLSGCAALEELLQKPTVAFQNLDMQDLSFSGATLLFHFAVQNPNPIGFAVSEASYDLKLNQKEFLKGTLDQGLSLPASGSAPLSIPFEIQFFDFFKTVQDFLREDSLKYALSGDLAIGSFRVPYSVAGSFALPKLPSISLKEVKIKSLTLNGASLAVALDVQNKNVHALQIQNVGYEIRLGDVLIADGSTGSLVPVGGGKSTQLTIPLNVNFLELGRSAYQILTKGSADYSISGDIGFDIPQIGVRAFPFSRKGSVSLTR